MKYQFTQTKFTHVEGRFNELSLFKTSVLEPLKKHFGEAYQIVYSWKVVISETVSLITGNIRQEVAEQRTVYIENAEVAQIVVAIDKKVLKERW